MSQECKCQIVRENLLGDYQERIAYCALHQAAPELVEALKLCRENLDNLLQPLSGQPDWQLVRRTIEALKQALTLAQEMP